MTWPAACEYGRFRGRGVGTRVEQMSSGRAGSTGCDHSGRRWHRTHSVSAVLTIRARPPQAAGYAPPIPCGCAPSRRKEQEMRHLRPSLLIAALAVMAMTACAARSPSIADLQYNPGRYYNRSVSVEGVVTSSWGVPLVPFKVYKVGDSSGEVTVVSNQSRVPPRGARVRVKGKVTEFGTFGGRSVGLHLREENLKVLGRG